MCEAWRALHYRAGAKVPCTGRRTTFRVGTSFPSAAAARPVTAQLWHLRLYSFAELNLPQSSTIIMKVASWEQSRWSVRRRAANGLYGLYGLLRLCKARSCAKRAWIINNYYMPTRHMRGSFWFGRVLPDNITSSFALDVWTRRYGGHAMVIFASRSGC